MTATINTQDITNSNVTPSSFNKLGAFENLAASCVQLWIWSMYTLMIDPDELFRKLSVNIIKLADQQLTQSSMTSFTAVIKSTMIKGTKVVHLEVGEIPGICYMILKWKWVESLNVYDWYMYEPECQKWTRKINLRIWRILRTETLARMWKQYICL